MIHKRTQVLNPGDIFHYYVIALGQMIGNSRTHDVCHQGAASVSFVKKLHT